MEGTARLVLISNISYKCMISFVFATFDEMIHQSRTYTPMLDLMVEIYSSLKTMTFISCTCIPWMGISIAYHTAVGFIDIIWMIGRNLGNTACHLVSRDRIQFKGHGSMHYIIIVYFRQSGGISDFCGANVVSIHKQSVI